MWNIYLIPKFFSILKYIPIKHLNTTLCVTTHIFLELSLIIFFKKILSLLATSPWDSPDGNLGSSPFFQFLINFGNFVYSLSIVNLQFFHN